MDNYEKIKVGDTVGIKAGTGFKKKIYRLAQVIKVTPKQIVTIEGRYWRDTGVAVGGLHWLVIMTKAQMNEWQRAQDAEQAAKKQRAAERNPADYDDSVQSALRSMRNKARGLCEKLQADVDQRLKVDPVGAMQPAWWGEFLQMLVEIEESEKALGSIGLSTTLKPSSEVSSLFR
jgi:hypothetical protein